MRNIEFVEYTGKYPCLCNGKLILKVDSKLVTVDEEFVSGGLCQIDAEGDDIVTDGPWEFIDTDSIFTEEEIQYITKLMNDNVPHGCCGGCI